MKKMLCMFLLCLILATQTKLVYASPLPNETRNPDIFVLTTKETSDSSLLSLLNNYGFKATMSSDIHTAEHASLVIVPGESAQEMSQKDVEELLGKIKQSATLLTDSPSLLSQTIGLSWSSKKGLVPFYLWQGKRKNVVELPSSLPFDVFSAPSQSRILAETALNEPLCVEFKYKNVRCVYSALPLGASIDIGTVYPFFFDLLQYEWNILPEKHAPEKNISTLSIMIDWGFFYDRDPVSFAKQIASEGFSRCILSAWYTSPDYVDFTKKFIEEAHKQNMTIEAWLELPLVSEEFWNTYPEWREKTALLSDAFIEWRPLMALEDPNCFKETIRFLQKHLNSFSWDGIYIADLYFEHPDEGIGDPARFTPMHPSFRESYAQIHRKDPASFFLPGKDISEEDQTTLLQTRRETLTQIYTQLLKELMKEDQFQNKEVALIMLDSLSSQHLAETAGIDSQSLLFLAKENKIPYIVREPYAPDLEQQERVNSLVRVLNEHYDENRTGIVLNAESQGIPLLEAIRSSLSVFPQYTLLNSYYLLNKEDLEMLPFILSREQKNSPQQEE